jgi:protein PhnA
MNLNTECPKCHSESAYHDGVCYVCPDCEYEWKD